jgi:hypothetical protein
VVEPPLEGKEVNLLVDAAFALRPPGRVLEQEMVPLLCAEDDTKGPIAGLLRGMVAEMAENRSGHENIAYATVAL